jgi:hypothetical protein
MTKPILAVFLAFTLTGCVFVDRDLQIEAENEIPYEEREVIMLGGTEAFDSCAPQHAYDGRC